MKFFDRIKTSGKILFSGYDATRTTRSRRARRPTTIRREELELGSGDRQKIVAQLIDYRRNHPLVKAICRLREQDVVGAGIIPKAETGDDDLDDQLESLWRRYTDAPEISGLSMRELQSLLASSTLTQGDSGLLLLEGGQCQFIEGDQIGSEGDNWLSRNDDPNLVEGVRLDDFGRPLKFQIGTRRNGKLENVREVLARDFVFHRKRFRGAQTRGIPELASVLDTLQDVKEYDDTEMLAAKIAATMSAVVKRENSMEFELAAREVEEERLEYLEAGKVIYLEPNEDISVVSSNGRPNTDAIEWITYKLRVVGSALGIPVEFLLQTIGETSFSASQGMVLLYQATVENEQRALFPALSRLWRWKVANWIREGEVDVPTRVNPYAVSWQPPTFRWVNRAAQVQADQLYLQMGAISLEDVCGTFGKDSLTVMRRKAREIAKAKEIAEENGLDSWRDIFNPVATFGSAAIELEQPETEETNNEKDR